MKISEYAQLVAPYKLTEFQIKLLDETEKAIRNNTPMPIVVGMRSGKTWILRVIREWEEQYCEVNMADLSEQIKDKAEVIAKLLSSGKHVELCENKDGLRIVAMDRKVVKL